MLMKPVTKLAASLAALGLSFNVLAAELNVYASMPEKYASQVLEQFTKETGIKVNFLRLSSGEVLSASKQKKAILRSMCFWEARRIILKLLRTRG